MTTPRTYDNTAPGWCCTDCLFLLANGDTPLDWSSDEIADWLAEIARREAGGHWSLGRMFGEGCCEHTVEDWQADPEAHAYECERLEFSWSQCDVCGSLLGGAREAVTFWLGAERFDAK